MWSVYKLHAIICIILQYLFYVYRNVHKIFSDRLNHGFRMLYRANCLSRNSELGRVISHDSKWALMVKKIWFYRSIQKEPVKEMPEQSEEFREFFSPKYGLLLAFSFPSGSRSSKATLALNVLSPSSFQPLCCLQVWIHTECLIFSSFQMVTFWSSKNVEENIFYSQNDTFPKTSERITLQIMSPIIPFAKVSRRVCRIIIGIINNKHFKRWVLGKQRCRLKCCTI